MSTAYLPIELAGIPLLLDARSVREVIGPCAVVRVPHATLRLPGVFSWKGLALPWIDTARAMGLGQDGATPSRQRTIIVEVNAELAGLSADEVREVVTVEQNALLPVHAAPRSFASAEVEWSGRIATVLDLTALVSSVFAMPNRDG